MAQDTINISDIFFGSTQSKYAGVALFMTILILCLIILFSNSKIPIGERFLFVLFILIISIPSILMSLFELTCIVTGGNYTTRWWCWLLAWVISVIIIIYCVLIIISMFISISNFEMANERINYTEEKNKMNKEDAEMYAKNMLNSHEANEVNSRSAHPQMNDMNGMNGMNGMNSMNGVHEVHEVHGMNGVHEVHGMNGVNGMNGAKSAQPQVPSMQSAEPPQYSEPKHNVNGNMISFPQNSSDLTGFEADDKYLSIDKANVSDINYTSEYKLSKAANNSVTNYDGFDSTDKLSPY